MKKRVIPLVIIFLLIIPLTFAFSPPISLPNLLKEANINLANFLNHERPYYSPTSCIEPSINMIITESTTFCSGTYTFIEEGITDFIKIEADNVVLDCNNAEFVFSNGLPPKGIFVKDYNNVEIRNCNIHSITAENSDNLIIEDNNFNYGPTVPNQAKKVSLTDSNFFLIRNNIFSGVWLKIHRCHDGEVISNIMDGCIRDIDYNGQNQHCTCAYGIQMSNSNRNKIHYNEIKAISKTAIYLTNSFNIEISNNQIHPWDPVLMLTDSYTYFISAAEMDFSSTMPIPLPNCIYIYNSLYSEIQANTLEECNGIGADFAAEENLISDNDIINLEQSYFVKRRYNYRHIRPVITGGDNDYFYSNGHYDLDNHYSIFLGGTLPAGAINNLFMYNRISGYKDRSYAVSSGIAGPNIIVKTDDSGNVAVRGDLKENRFINNYVEGVAVEIYEDNPIDPEENETDQNGTDYNETELNPDLDQQECDSNYNCYGYSCFGQNLFVGANTAPTGNCCGDDTKEIFRFTTKSWTDDHGIIHDQIVKACCLDVIYDVDVSGDCVLIDSTYFADISGDIYIRTEKISYLKDDPIHLT